MADSVPGGDIRDIPKSDAALDRPDATVVGAGDRWSKYAVYALLWGIPLMTFPWGLDRNEEPKFAFFRIATALALLAFFSAAYRRGRIEARPTVFDRPVQAALVFTALSTAGSVYFPVSVWGARSRYDGLFTMAFYVLAYYLVANVIRRRADLSVALAGLFAVAGIVSIYGLLQAFGYDIAGAFTAARIQSTFGSAVYLGAYLTLVVPLALAVALHSLGEEGSPAAEVQRARAEVRWSWVALVAGWACLIFTFTRAAWAGTILGGALVVVLATRRDREGGRGLARRTIAAVAVVAVVGLGVYYARGIGTAGTLSARVMSAAGLSGDRAYLWKTSLPVIRDYPLTGSGPDTYGLVYPRYRPANWYRVFSEKSRLPDKVHNELLQVAATKGALTLLSFLWLVILVAWAGLRAARRAPPSLGRSALIGLWSGCLGYGVQLIFSFSEPGTTALFWMALGLLAALIGQVGSGRRTSHWQLRESEPTTGRRVLTMGLGWAGVALIAWAAMSSLGADYYLRQAADAESTGDYATGIQAARAATRLQPAEELAWRLLGDNEVRLGTQLPVAPGVSPEKREAYVRAAAAYRRAYRLNPREIMTPLSLGDTYRTGAVQLGRPEWLGVAAAWYRTLLELDPNSAEGRLKLGFTYLLMSGRLPLSAGVPGGQPGTQPGAPGPQGGSTAPRWLAGARRELRRSIALEPDNAVARGLLQQAE